MIRQYASPKFAEPIAAALNGSVTGGGQFVEAEATPEEWAAAETAAGICPACGWVLGHAHKAGVCGGCCVHPRR